MSEQFFQQLFHYSKEVTPYLHGSIGVIEPGAIHLDNDINPIVQELYQTLSKVHPEPVKPIGLLEHGTYCVGNRCFWHSFLFMAFTRYLI